MLQNIYVVVKHSPLQTVSSDISLSSSTHHPLNRFRRCPSFFGSSDYTTGAIGEPVHEGVQRNRSILTAVAGSDQFENVKND